MSLNETPPYLGNYVFPYGYVDGDHQGTYLLVPLGCKEKYQSYNQNNTPYFARIFEFEPEKGEYLVLKSYGGGKVIYDGQEVSNDKNAFTVAAGKRITLEIVADDGYELSSCIIDGDSIKELTRESDNTFSCTLIADKGHRIDAYFTEKIIEGSYLSVDNFYYKVLSNNELELHLRYNYHDAIPIYYSGDIVIPDSVVLPASFSQPQRVYKVTSIDKNAFYVYNGVENKLKSVVIGNNVTKIEDGTFRNCSNLVSVTLGTKINSIGDRAFYNCPKLTSVTIGSNVKTIGPWAFRSCYCLTSIDIPSSVITIGDEAFSGCPLTSIAIPNSITSIGADAFKNTPWYDNQPDGMVYAGKVAYKYKGEMPSNTSIELIEGTLGIAGGAFYNCSGLTSIIIPSSVTNIGSGTFIFCSNLSSILSFNPTPPSMTTVSFNDSTATVYVPIGSKEAYRWADGWRYFKKIVDVLSDVDMSGQQSVMINEENFPDENFRAYLLSQSYGKDSVITKVEKMITTSLTISGRNIFDLKGIEHFPALTKLTVRSLPLSKLDLSKNTALTSLECYYTDLTNLDLSKNTALTSLKCSINQLTSLDVSKNTALTSLNCSSNQLTSLDVSKNTALTSLNCSSNQLTSLDVSKNTALKEMNCYRNRLTNLDVSKENVALTNLECSSNQIRGEAMDALVNNLPIQEQAKLFIISLTYSEGNLCTTAQVHAANERGWQVFASSGEEYKGSDPSGIAIIEENFPDRNFRSFLLREPYGKDGAITNEEIESITYMSLTTFSGGSYSISDLKGIEYFSALTNLKLRGCSNLTSIDLSKNTALDSLEIVNCRLTSLDLTKNTALTYLDCTSNQFTSLDLSNNTALTILNCASNQLTSLDVSKNVALTSLDCSNNQLTSLNLSNAVALTSIICSGNHLTLLDLSSNTALTRLDCSNNQLTSLDLPNSSELISINCTTNRLTSLDVSGNMALTSLDCASNQLTSLDVSKNTALTRLACNGNELTSLDVSENTALTQFGCSNNYLTNLDVSKNMALTSLNCRENKLTSLDVSKNVNLVGLGCQYNQLTNLDVSRNANLTGLNCQDNQLTVLDVSKNSALAELYCSYNQLTSLDVSENSALEVLSCNGNQLTILDVSKNPALIKLQCSYNQITSLDLSENTALRELYCSMNQIKDEAMNTLVNSLPKQERASLYVLSLTDSTEGNVCTKANVNTAKEKGWNVLAYRDFSWRDYEGSDPSEIHAFTLDKDAKVPIYDLNGRKLQMPRRGINIIGGKKVVVK